MNILFLFFVFALILFIVFYRIMKDTSLYFFSVICGILSFVFSVILHYFLPDLFLSLWRFKFMKVVQAFLFTAFIEEGVRFYFFKFLLKRKISKLALSLMTVSLIFSVLESTYYWNTDSHFNFLFFRLFGALPLHLGTAFLLVFLPRYKFVLCVLFHGTYNYMLLTHAPWFISVFVLILLLITNIYLWLWFKVKGTLIKVKYFKY